MEFVGFTQKLIVQASEAPEPFPDLPKVLSNKAALPPKNCVLLKRMLFVLLNGGVLTVNTIVSESSPL